jgi:hypothetical protein
MVNDRMLIPLPTKRKPARKTTEKKTGKSTRIWRTTTWIN